MSNGTEPRILIVDDKVDIVETLSFCFAQEGYMVFTAFDGPGALEVARGEQPDLIVLDVMLPGENGYQVARFLREDWKEGKLRERPKILLLTARTVETEREEFLSTWSGADAFMYKPFDLEELVAKVKEILAQERALTLGS
jgi:two-component system alkaline phosphatase synthesis response regulator PhoP